MTATTPKKKRETSEEQRPPDTFGVGQLADGSLNVVAPAEYTKRVAERDAEEAAFNEGEDDGR